ncbi:MAG: DUF4924 family protein [Rikenellaceae bacterium]|jgi:hypothetical protein|nr:DUF4924 family protein [Rikenellaceae bacterium]
MVIAKLKRRENIAEYILYLWQLEDLFRALQFSPEAIFSQLAAPMQADDETKQEVFLWYMELIDLLKAEGKEVHGHLEHTLHLIGSLQELHEALLALPAGAEYRKVFTPLASELPALKARLGRAEMSDIEFCLRALYSVMLYRIKGDEAHREYVDDVMTLVSPAIALLTKLNREIEEGSFDLCKNEQP